MVLEKGFMEIAGIMIILIFSYIKNTLMVTGLLMVLKTAKYPSYQSIKMLHIILKGAPAHHSCLYPPMGTLT